MPLEVWLALARTAHRQYLRVSHSSVIFSPVPTTYSMYNVIIPLSRGVIHMLLLGKCHMLFCSYSVVMANAKRLVSDA